MEHHNFARISGANMDIDLISQDKTTWQQGTCPCNQAENVNDHKCATKNISICKYFYGIEYPDTVICCYPADNPFSRPSP